MTLGMPEFLLRELEVLFLTLYQPASHPSMPGQRVGLDPWEPSCLGRLGAFQKSWRGWGLCVCGTFQLGQEACRPQLRYKYSRGNQRKCYLQLLVNVARSTLVRPQEKGHVRSYTINQKWQLKWKKTKFVHGRGTFLGAQIMPNPHCRGPS